jgi:hypothetical protein
MECDQGMGSGFLDVYLMFTKFSAISPERSKLSGDLTRRLNGAASSHISPVIN